MTLLEKMDRAVYATGIDRLIFRRMTPRTLRWTPLLVLAALVAGYVLTARILPLSGARLLVGMLLLYGGLLLAMLLRIFGPRLVGTTGDPLDERELMIKARASAASGNMLVLLAMAGCFYMGGAVVLGWWQPRTPFDWFNLGMALEGIFFLLPTLIASWLQPVSVGGDAD